MDCLRKSAAMNLFTTRPCLLVGYHFGCAEFIGIVKGLRGELDIYPPYLDANEKMLIFNFFFLVFSFFG